jgi:hypothetical protein
MQISTLTANTYARSGDNQVSPSGSAETQEDYSGLESDGFVASFADKGQVLPDDMNGQALSSGTYYLDKDYYIEGSALRIEDGQAVTVDLMGHTLIAPEGDSAIINMGELTLTDSVGSGGISSAAKDNIAERGGAIYNGETGILVLDSINIYGAAASIEGGGIYNAGDLTVTGGSIHHCQAPDGGAISNRKGGSTELMAVEIYSNTAVSGNGGGLFVASGSVVIDGGAIRDNCAQGSPAEDVSTACNPYKDLGVGGGIFVYGTGMVTMNAYSQTMDGAVNIYANKADFAANDIFCAPGSAVVALPLISGLDLIDSDGQFIGQAQGWYDDYPVGDTMRPGVSSQGRGSSEYSFICAEGGVKKLSGYRCLTVGYEYTRVSLTVQLEGEQAPESQLFYFTAEIEGGLDEIESEHQELAKVQNVVPALVFSAESGEYTVLKSGTYTDDAEVKFALKAGESVEIRGLPVNSTVTLVETGTSSSSGQSWPLTVGSIGATADGNDDVDYYETSYVWDDGSVKQGTRYEDMDMGESSRFVVVRNE